jgi:hypothetical protein
LSSAQSNIEAGVKSAIPVTEVVKVPNSDDVAKKLEEGLGYIAAA